MRLGLNLRHWRVTSEWDGTVVLEMDRHESSASELSWELRTELTRILDKLTALDIPGLIICSAKSIGFSVGADVTEFNDPNQIAQNIQQGQQLLDYLSSCKFPTVAAIHGHCLGGGCEMALACTYRVAAENTSIGLPEVRLGVHPGWGATARLPDLIGSYNALPLLLGGKPIKAAHALKLGIVDSVCTQPQLRNEARKVLYSATQKPSLQQAMVWCSNAWPIRQVLSEFLVWKIRKQVQEDQYPAPFKIISLWREYGSWEQRLANEAASLYSLANTRTAQNLMEISLLEESLKKGDRSSHGFKHIHIMGSTILAGELAALCATKEFTVTTHEDISEYSNKFFNREESPASIRGCLARDPKGLGVADAVIEALPEDLGLKRSLFMDISPKVKDGALLITTTGVFSLESLSMGLNEDITGLHLFDPVGLVPLAEIPQTYEASRLVSFAKALGKLPIISKSRPGLLVNRVMTPYIFEALYMLEEGSSASAIDRAATNFGMLMGPLEYIDTIGLDVWATYAREIAPLLNLKVPRILVDPQNCGKKDGQGIYTWVDGKAVKEPTTDNVHTDRLILMLVCASLTASQLKIVAGPDLVDGAIVFSAGFAPFLGGPIKFSKSIDFAQRLELLRNRYGDRFTVRKSDDFNLI